MMSAPKNIRPERNTDDHLNYWISKIEAGWQPNRRIRAMGYSELAEFFGVEDHVYLGKIKHLLWPSK